MGNNTLSRQALPVAVSWDSATRQAVVVASTAAPQADGVALMHTRDAIRWPSRPLPVFVNHDAHPREFVGSVTALELGREKGVTALIATVQLADSEAGRLAEPMVASGAARWSIRARIHNLERGPAGSDFDRAIDWEPVELSLVGIGMDAAAVTRSADFQNNKQEATPVTMTNDNEQTQTLERSRCAAIIDAARKLQVSDDLAHQLIENGTELSAARMALIDARSAEERKTPAQSRSEIMPVNQESQLAQSISRAMSGERLAEPLWLQLRREGVPGRNSADVFRSWLQGRRDASVTRGMHSTSDAPALLLGAGDRMLQAQFAIAAGGVLAAADVRSLNDYRPASIIDVGKVGSAKKILEGGEVKFSTIAESSTSYKPARWGDGLAVSPEALANDDLDGLRQAISELGAAALDAERTELAYLLEGTSLGATAADGKAIFHADHSNVVSTGPLALPKLGAAVALLRGQKTVGGRHIDQQPGVILCGLQAEMTVRQLLSDTVTPNAPENANPFRDLTVEVDARLGDTYLYLISAGPRKPLELGRLYAAPLVSDEVHFDTGAYRIKAEHAFGVAVSEFRAIVRMKLAA
jgi:hypothetical protein